MAEGQLYFLKLKRDFFKRHDIRLIDAQFKADGIKFYLWMLCESLDHEGRLRFSESRPYSIEDLAILAGVDQDTAENMMLFLKQCDMVAVESDGTIIMKTMDSFIAPDTGAERSRRYRERKRAEKNVTDASRDRHETDTQASRDRHETATRPRQSIEYRVQSIEYRDQKEKEKDIVNTNVLKKGESIKRFAPPTLEEVQSYSSEKGYHIDCQRFIDYYESNGWKVGRNPMKDWKAAVRSWAARDKQENSSAPKTPEGWEDLDKYFHKAGG